MNLLPLVTTALVIGASLTGCSAMDVASSGSEDGRYNRGFDAGVSYDEGEAADPSIPPNPDAPAVNPFVAASHDPFSTFGADVDTASYQYWRRTVADGYLPEPVNVRLEDFVNYFRYDYAAPAPDAEAPFAISIAAAGHPMGRKTDLVRIGIQARSASETEKRPANLVFLVDTSGSMQSEDKLPLVQMVLRETLDVLDDADTVSIVTYASGVSVALSPTPISERELIEDAINGFAAGGSTAGADGIDAAYAQAEAGHIEGGINHVLLLTDGDFNVGPATNEALLELIRSKRASGTTLTALGFGTDNLNDGMMEAVSNAGNGIYGFIGSSDDAVAYVQERMLSTLEHVAKDMKIQVEWNPTHVLAYRLLGYENRAIADEDFRNDVVDAGEVGAEHRVTALYEIVPVGSTVPMPEGAPALDDGEPKAGEREIAAHELVRVKVRWKSVDASDADAAFETTARLLPGDVAASLESSEEDLLWAGAVAALAERLMGSPYAAPGELETIGEIAAAQSARDKDRAEFELLLEQTRDLLATNPDR